MKLNLLFLNRTPNRFCGKNSLEKIDMNNLQTKLDCLGQKIEARSQTTDVLLPDWPESKRGTPNSFLRSALFSVNDCKKERPHLDRVILASQEGITVTY